MAHDPKVRAKALQLSRAGVPQREIATRLDVSPSTVCKWLRAAPDLGAPLEPPHAEPPRYAAPPTPESEPEAPAGAPLPPPAAATGSAEDLIRETLGTLQALAAEARQQGHFVAATRLARDLGKVANDLARLESKAKDNADAVVMSREQIEAAQKAVADRLAVLAKVEMTCAECGRKLRIRHASDGEVQE